MAKKVSLGSKCGNEWNEIPWELLTVKLMQWMKNWEFLLENVIKDNGGHLKLLGAARMLWHSESRSKERQMDSLLSLVRFLLVCWLDQAPGHNYLTDKVRNSSKKYYSLRSCVPWTLNVYFALCARVLINSFSHISRSISTKWNGLLPAQGWWQAFKTLL